MKNPAMILVLFVSLFFLCIVSCDDDDKTVQDTLSSPTVAPTNTFTATETPLPTEIPTETPASTPTPTDSPLTTETPTGEPTSTPTSEPSSTGVTINHETMHISQVPEYWIEQARSNLHVVYEHSSHGTQLVSGMESLDTFMGGSGLYDFSMDTKYQFPEGGSFWDEAMEGYGEGTLDLSHETTWYPATVALLDDPDNYDVNVVIWSWCNILGHSIPDYLSNMESLIATYGEGGSAPRATDHPVTFVFMTGHVNGDGGESGSTFEQNQAIRDHCTANGRWLYDFADIEKYDLDGNYFGDKNPTDGCYYDGGNWAIEYQNSHTQGVDWYDCESAHSQPVNANQKAYATWWMLARLAGWNGGIE